MTARRPAPPPPARPPAGAPGRRRPGRGGPARPGRLRRRRPPPPASGAGRGDGGAAKVSAKDCPLAALDEADGPGQGEHVVQRPGGAAADGADRHGQGVQRQPGQGGGHRQQPGQRLPGGPRQVRGRGRHARPAAADHLPRGHDARRDGRQGPGAAGRGVHAGRRLRPHPDHARPPEPPTAWTTCCTRAT